MTTTEKRITALEKKYGYVEGRVPGTSFVRIITEHDGIQWSLGLGLMQDRKQYFVAPTISECLDKAEKSVIVYESLG